MSQFRHKWRCDIRLSTMDSGWRGLLDNREIIGEAARTTVLVIYSIIRSSYIQNRQNTTIPPPPSCCLRNGIGASRQSSTNTYNVFPVIGLIPRNFFLACIKHVPFFTYINSIAFVSKRHAFRHLMREQGIRVNTLGAMHKMLQAQGCCMCPKLLPAETAHIVRATGTTKTPFISDVNIAD